VTIIEVSIGPGEPAGSFRVRVLHSPAGEAQSVVQLDLDELRKRCAQLEHIVLVSASASRSAFAQAERQLREVGQILFSALLGTGEVAGRYRASAALAAKQQQALRVVLHLETAALASLTWEAMYDPETGAYVCRRDQLVRHIPVPSVAAPLTVRPPLRILSVVSTPRGLSALNVAKEQEQLTNSLARPLADGLVEVRWAQEATWAGLHDLLLGGKWHVVHFIGHGRFDAELNEGALALVSEDGGAEWADAVGLVDLLRQARPMPRLVVLNSCSGAVSGPRDFFSGTAAALVRGGVSAVVAMQHPISDPAATAFARGFYAAIARGRGVDDATSSGRVAIIGTSARTLEWITPVVYLRGRDSRLFSLSNKPPLVALPPDYVRSGE
jgi:CHAT domain